MINKERESNIPEWYWKNGLHDAKIISVSEIIVPPDWKTIFSEEKYLDIRLDGRVAQYERDIKVITLYNYSIQTKDIELNELNNAWWMSDAVESLNDGFYRMTIEYIPSEADCSEQFVVEFSGVKINRD